MVKIRNLFQKILLAGTVFSVFAMSGFSQSSINSASKKTGESESKIKTVKVGWFYSARFQEGMSDDEPKSGYCYEYLQKISDYNSWQYEFVYGEWGELLEKLQKGEIDAMAGVSKTKERQQTMNFPNQGMGFDYYYLFQHADDKKMNPSDLKTFEGKRIGGIKDNRMTLFLENWAKENGIHFNMVYFDGFNERDRAFKNRTIDGMTATDANIFSNTDYVPVVKVGEEPYYLALTNKRPGLLADLNKALDIMQSMDPYFLENLQYTSYGTTVTNGQLSEDEEKWVSEHKVLKLGYIDNYLPFCESCKDGKIHGLITDVLDAAIEELSLKDSLTVNYTPFDTYTEVLVALKKGDIDAVFPIGGSIWEIDRDGMNFTTPVLTTGMSLVYKGNYSEKTVSKIAVNRNNNVQFYYIKSVFPDADFYYCNSITDCLEAVKNGKAESTILNGLRVNLVRNNSRYISLSTLQLEKNDARYIGVKKGNVPLLLLLNRGIKLIGRDFGANASYRYMDEFYSITMLDFIRKNVVLIGCIFIAIVCFVVFMLVRDARISKQKAIQEIRLNKKLEHARQKAEAASKAKTSFLFNMSHDIRTPMNAIMGFRDLLEKNQENPEKRADYLKKIEDSSKVLLSIIDNVLEMARIENGKIELQETEVSVEEFNNSVFTVFKEMMQKKGLNFTQNVSVQNHYIFCDQIKLREIMLNIVSNAYKYTNSGGSISMKLEELPYDREGWGLYRTTVKDTGMGISEEYLPHIFEEFSRERNTTEAKIEGTGLGMPIVKRLVDLMKGKIEVISKKGEGTTMVVTIPFRIAENKNIAGPETIETAPVSFKGKRILLAEDNELNAEIAIEILKGLEFEVEWAKDGKICVDMLKNSVAGYYNLILMDIQMPNMNGYEATREIRCLEDKNKAEIKILAMTANAFEEDRKNALSAGMNGHLTKPIDIKVLLKELSAALS